MIQKTSAKLCEWLKAASCPPYHRATIERVAIERFAIDCARARARPQLYCRRRQIARACIAYVYQLFRREMHVAQNGSTTTPRCFVFKYEISKLAFLQQ